MPHSPRAEKVFDGSYGFFMAWAGPVPQPHFRNCSGWLAGWDPYNLVELLIRHMLICMCKHMSMSCVWLITMQCRTFSALPLFFIWEKIFHTCNSDDNINKMLKGLINSMTPLSECLKITPFLQTRPLKLNSWLHCWTSYSVFEYRKILYIYICS